MIVVKSDEKRTVLALVNYGVYQDKDDDKASQKRRENDAGASHEHTTRMIRRRRMKRMILYSPTNQILLHVLTKKLLTCIIPFAPHSREWLR